MRELELLDASAEGDIYGPYYYQKYANMYNNTWSNISYGGTVYGMYFYMYYTESANVYNNTWRNITTGGANLYGIYVYYTGGGSTNTRPVQYL